MMELLFYNSLPLAKLLYLYFFDWIGLCNQNYWISWLFTSFRILNTKKYNILELDLFSSSGEGGDTYSVQSLGKS
jgi:hypothetical protein